MARSCRLVPALLLGMALTEQACSQSIAFVRGDANVDGTVDISDPVFTLVFLFSGAVPGIPCQDAADANGDAGVVTPGS